MQEKIFLHFNNFLSMLLLLVFVFILSACGNNRARLTPYETGLLSVRKAPLILPPDYKLRPPKVGQSVKRKTNGSGQYLLGDGVASPPSAIERELITKIGALDVDPNIRARMFNDSGNVIDVSSNLSNMLIFWSNFKGDINFKDAPLAAKNKDVWLADRKKQVLELIGEDKVVISYDKSLLLPGIR